jgi:hypothetical protein
MSVHLISANQTITGDDDSLFIIVGNANLTLDHNSDSLTFITAGSSSAFVPPSISLDPTDSNEAIVDLTLGAGARMTPGAAASVNVMGGISGQSYIFGFGSDPNAELVFNHGTEGGGGTPFFGDFTLSSDGHGGTLINTSWMVSATGATGQGTIDIVGDSHIASGLGSSAHETILRNT